MDLMVDLAVVLLVDFLNQVVDGGSYGNDGGGANGSPLGGDNYRGAVAVALVVPTAICGSTPGIGGDGTASSITGTSVTRAGGGGGGGGNGTSKPDASGGPGGGGTGGYGIAGTDGTVHRFWRWRWRIF